MRFTITPLILPAVVAATDLIVPLYSHPGPDGVAWNPVLSALTNHPDLPTIVILNVANGPGNPFNNTEGADWITGSQSLGDLDNVSLLGYVPVNRARRSIQDAKRDVMAWARWEANHDIPISGIFIDEAPSDRNATFYMRELSQYIRHCAGLGMVIYNPGFSSSAGALDTYYDQGPTYITALETCFTATSNGQDLCTGNYTIYDAGGYGNTIDTTLSNWVGEDNYPDTGLLIHGFHGSNGRFEANDETLIGMLEAVVDRDIGAVAFSTDHWTSPGDGPADIETVASLLDMANSA